MNSRSTYRVSVHQDVVYTIEVEAPSLHAAIAQAQTFYALRGPEPDYGWDIQPQKERGWTAEKFSA